MVVHKLLRTCIILGLVLSPHTGIADEKWEALAILNALAYKPLCDKHIPGYKEKTAASYASWRRENREMVELMENEIANAQRSGRAKESKDLSPPELSKVENICRDMAREFEGSTRP